MDCAGHQLLGHAQGRVLLMALRRELGFNLIEIMVVIAVIGIMTTLGMPAFTDWINNTKIRTATEGIVNGVQLARTEAVRQNLSVQFVLGGTSSSDWTVSSIDGGGAITALQTRVGGSSNAVIAVLPAASSTVTFSGLGRIVANGDGSASLTQIDICSAASMAAGTMRKMRVAIGAGGNVKMCDPQVPATDPRGCPAGGASQC
jgi:type IV fimbrial biogenesis protein FimT